MMFKRLTQQGVMALVAFLALGLGPTLAEAATPQQGSDSEVQASLEALIAAEAALDDAYGFSGSKDTVARVIARRQVAPERATKVAARLYMVWRKVQPFFKAHRENLRSHLQAWSDGGSMPAHEVAWLREALRDVEGHHQKLARLLEELVRLNGERLVAVEALVKAKANAEATRKATRGVGSRGMRELLQRAEQAIAVATRNLKAASEAVVSHETLCMKESTALLLPAFTPLAERPLHTIAAVNLGQAATAKVSSEATSSDSLVTLDSDVQTQVKTLEDLRQEAQRRSSLADTDAQEVAALEAKLESVKAAVDLPEVRAAMTKRGELEARLLAQRQVIKDTNTSTPEGYRQAEIAAQEILKLQTALPGLDAELTRLRSKANMMRWRKEQRGIVAAARAKAQISREESHRAALSVLKGEYSLRRAQGRLLEASLGFQAAEVSAFAMSVTTFPELTAINVSRPTGTQPISVLRVLKPRRTTLIETVTNLRSAQSGLTQAAAALESAWAVYEARMQAMRTLPYPPEALDKVIMEVWKGTVKRLALKSAGTSLRGLRDAFKAAPSPESLALWVDNVGNAAIGDLTLALASFEKLLSSSATQRNLVRSVHRAMTRHGFNDLAPSSPQVRAVASYLDLMAFAPFLRLAAGAHERARAEASQLSEVAGDLTRGLMPSMAGRGRAEGALRQGDPVSVTLSFQDKRARWCPAVSIGDQALPAPDRRRQGFCRYTLLRLASLPDGPAILSLRPAP